MPSPVIPSVTLNDGTSMPQFGFGLFQVPDEHATSVALEALSAGYRALDTAAFYGNEAGTGRAVAESGLPRDQIHVTTKLWHTDLGYDAALRAMERSLAKLQLSYVDLYLIHWPVPPRNLYAETWRAFEKIQEDGLARSIGVSNFPQAQLEVLLRESSIIPAVNQIELHPRLPQRELREFDARHGIATQAWSPLAHGQLIDDPVCAAVAARHGKTTAQILLRWNIELGNLVVAKSVTPKRIRSNLDIFGFTLSADDREQLATLDTGTRTGADPAEFGA